MKKSEVIDTQVGDVHVKDTQIADVNIGTYGSEDYVLSTGQKIRAELITNNTLRIFDGVMVYCGVRDAVAVDDYHDVTIENGSQGMNRNDIAVRYFKKDATTGYGAAEFKAIKGTPTSGTATDPEITVTDLRSGDIDHSMKLYRVRLEGLNIVAVEPLFNVLMPMSEQQAMLAELNRKIGNDGNYKFDAVVWTNPTYQITQKNGWVDINYHATVSGGTASKEFTIASIPEEIRPDNQREFAGWVADGTGKRYAASVKIYTSGTIALIAEAAFSEAGFAAVYPV